MIKTMLEKLEEAIHLYIRELADRKGWEEVHREHSAMGALRDYRCGNLLIRVINERGLVDVEIAPASQITSFRSVSLLMDWLQPAKQGRWNLGIGGSAKFLQQHWDRLDSLLSPQQCKASLEEVDAVARSLR
jgi:hypothetical protein